MQRDEMSMRHCSYSVGRMLLSSDFVFEETGDQNKTVRLKPSTSVNTVNGYQTKKKIFYQTDD